MLYLDGTHSAAPNLQSSFIAASTRPPNDKVMVAGYTLVVKAPIELYNALPMPLTVALSSTDPDRSSLPERMLVQPLQSLLLHQMGAFHHLDKVALEPSGYCLSSAMGLPHGPSPRNGCASTSSCTPALAHVYLSVCQSLEAAISLGAMS